MVLGRDVSFKEVSTLSMCALVGRVNYWALSKYEIEGWVEDQWKSFLGYSLEIMVLVRGWFCFKFKEAKDVKKILGRVWLCGSGSMMLN